MVPRPNPATRTQQQGKRCQTDVPLSESKLQAVGKPLFKQVHCVYDRHQPLVCVQVLGFKSTFWTFPAEISVVSINKLINKYFVYLSFFAISVNFDHFRPCWKFVKHSRTFPNITFSACGAFWQHMDWLDSGKEFLRHFET